MTDATDTIELAEGLRLASALLAVAPEVGAQLLTPAEGWRKVRRLLAAGGDVSGALLRHVLHLERIDVSGVYPDPSTAGIWVCGQMLMFAADLKGRVQRILKLKG